MKSKTTATILALFLGGLGVHKFYLDKNIMGFLYLIFFWTFIPAIISFIEALILMNTSEESFNAKYNSKYVTTNTNSVPYTNRTPNMTTSKKLLYGTLILSLLFLYLANHLGFVGNHNVDTSVPPPTLKKNVR